METPTATRGLADGRGSIRLAAWAGIAFFGWVVVAMTVFAGIMPLPVFSDPVDYYREFYIDNATVVHLHVWFSCLFWLFGLLTFATGLRQLLDEGQHRSMLTRLMTIGAVLTVTFGGLGLFFEIIVVSVAADASNDLLLALGRVVALSHNFLWWGFSLFVLPSSIAILQNGVLGRKLAWFGVTSAALMILGTAWPITGTDAGILATLGLIGVSLVLIWVLLAAIQMLRLTAEPDLRRRS